MKKPIPDFLLILLTMAVVIAVWWGAWHWIDSNIISTDTNVGSEALRGQFGDKFGAINALFSGCAFAGIIVTILLQKRDLKATRDVMSHERFDNTFFQLLKLHTDIVDKLASRGLTGQDALIGFNKYLKSLDPDFNGFSALQKLTRDQIRRIIDDPEINTTLYPTLSNDDVANLVSAKDKGNQTFSNFLDDDLILHEKKIVDAYTICCTEYIDDFSHYFRNLYHILKFIDDSDLDVRVKKSYGKFLRSQLSEIELISIFYNSIARIKLPNREHLELGYPKMAILIQKYDVLQNMNPLSIFHPKHKVIFYNNNKVAANAE